jgi:hypothetical protein
MDRETELREKLAQLHSEYSAKVQPIVDELVAIEAAKPPRPIILLMGNLEGFDFSSIADKIAAEGTVCNCPECVEMRKRAN